MKDYSNYHGTNLNTKLVHDGNLMLESVLNGFDGADVEINGIPYRAALYNKYSTRRSGKLKKMLTKSGQSAIGDLVKINEENWLVTTVPEDNSISQEATIEQCNNTLDIVGKPVEVIVGYDPMGRPIYETVPGDITSYPCIVKTSFYMSEDDKQINLPSGRIQITIQYTDNPDIVEDTEFAMYSRTYRIVGLDYTQSINKKGLIVILADRVQGGGGT